MHMSAIGHEALQSPPGIHPALALLCSCCIAFMICFVNVPEGVYKDSATPGGHIAIQSRLESLQIRPIKAHIYLYSSAETGVRCRDSDLRTDAVASSSHECKMCLAEAQGQCAGQRPHHDVILAACWC